MTSKLRGVLLAVLTAAGLSLALAACGSSSSSTTAAAAGSSTSSSVSASAPDCGTTAATTNVAQYLTRPTNIGISTPIKGGMPRGLSFAWIQGPFPDAVQIGNVLQQLTTKFGWKFYRIVASGSPESVKAAWDTALRFHPYAISQGLGGPPRAYYASELAQAAKEGIKLVAFSETSVTKPWVFGVGYGIGGIGQWGFGGLSADYAASKIQDGDQVLELNLPGVGLVQVQDAAFKAALLKLCPKTQFSTLNIPLSALGSTAPQMIASYIQAHPSIKYIFYTTIDLAIGVGPAFASAGITSPPIGSAVTTDPAGLQVIRQGTANLQATIMYPSVEGAYRLFDGLGRIYRGQSPAVDSDSTLEKWIVTKQNLPPGTGSLAAVADYQQQFYKLWGVSGS